ncbi:MAG: hypothetical protein GX877_00540 [Bacteroidales bacterium]|nr:hypothetical protein [Bacteroidales bacterium]
MKKILFIVGTLSLVISCNTPQDPADVAEDFLQAFFSSQYREAREYAGPELYDILDKTQAILDSLTEEEYKEVTRYLSTLEITVEKPNTITSDTIRLPYRVAFSRLPEPGNSVISLRKEGNTWKVFALD